MDIQKQILYEIEYMKREIKTNNINTTTLPPFITTIGHIHLAFSSSFFSYFLNSLVDQLSDSDLNLSLFTKFDHNLVHQDFLVLRGNPQS